MRVFVAGATGALSLPVIRLRVADGHEVVGLTRSPSRVSIIAKLRARPVIRNQQVVGSNPTGGSRKSKVRPGDIGYTMYRLHR